MKLKKKKTQVFIKQCCLYLQRIQISPHVSRDSLSPVCGIFFGNDIIFKGVNTKYLMNF